MFFYLKSTSPSPTNAFEKAFSRPETYEPQGFLIYTLGKFWAIIRNL